MSCQPVTECLKCGSRCGLFVLRWGPLSYSSSLTTLIRSSKSDDITEKAAQSLANALNHAKATVLTSLCARCVLPLLTQAVVSIGSLSSSTSPIKRSGQSKRKRKLPASSEVWQEPKYDSAELEAARAEESRQEKLTEQSFPPPSPFPSETS